MATGVASHLKCMPCGSRHIHAHHQCHVEHSPMKYGDIPVVDGNNLLGDCGTAGTYDAACAAENAYVVASNCVPSQPRCVREEVLTAADSHISRCNCPIVCCSTSEVCMNCRGTGRAAGNTFHNVPVQVIPARHIVTKVEKVPLVTQQQVKLPNQHDYKARVKEQYDARTQWMKQREELHRDAILEPSSLAQCTCSLGASRPDGGDPRSHAGPSKGVAFHASAYHPAAGSGYIYSADPRAAGPADVHSPHVGGIYSSGSGGQGGGSRPVEQDDTLDPLLPCTYPPNVSVDIGNDTFHRTSTYAASGLPIDMPTYSSPTSWSSRMKKGYV